jgi:hypothetical protein
MNGVRAIVASGCPDELMSAEMMKLVDDAANEARDLPAMAEAVEREFDQLLKSEGFSKAEWLVTEYEQIQKLRRDALHLAGTTVPIRYDKERILAGLSGLEMHTDEMEEFVRVNGSDLNAIDHLRFLRYYLGAEILSTSLARLIQSAVKHELTWKAKAALHEAAGPKVN